MTNAEKNISFAFVACRDNTEATTTTCSWNELAEILTMSPSDHGTLALAAYQVANAEVKATEKDGAGWLPVTLIPGGKRCRPRRRAAAIAFGLVLLLGAVLWVGWAEPVPQTLRLQVTSVHGGSTPAAGTNVYTVFREFQPVSGATAGRTVTVSNIFARAPVLGLR